MDPATDWVTGPDGGVLAYDGVNQHLVFNNPIPLRQSFSVVARVNIPDTDNHAILSVDAGVPLATLQTVLSGGQPSIDLRLRSTPNQQIRALASIGASLLNQWHDIAWVFNAVTKTGRVYLDGDLVGSSTNASFDPATMPANFFVLGARTNAGGTPNGNYFEDQMGRVLFYSRVLLPNEIKQHHTKPLALLTLRSRTPVGVTGAPPAFVSRPSHVIGGGIAA